MSIREGLFVIETRVMINAKDGGIESWTNRKMVVFEYDICLELY